MAASVGELDVFETRAKIDKSAISRAADPATLCYSLRRWRVTECLSPLCLIKLLNAIGRL